MRVGGRKSDTDGIFSDDDVEEKESELDPNDDQDLPLDNVETNSANKGQKSNKPKIFS